MKDHTFEPRSGDVVNAPTKDKLSMAGDWLAPVTVWLLVIMMGLAIAGFVLGER